MLPSPRAEEADDEEDEGDEASEPVGGHPANAKLQALNVLMTPYAVGRAPLRRGGAISAGSRVASSN